MPWMVSIVSLVTLFGATCVFPATQGQLACSSKSYTNISSPQYPGNYGNGERRCWNISTPEGSFTKITFESFELEFWHDYLKLDVGLPGKGYFILLTNPVELVGYTSSSDNNILAHFHSDSNFTAAGFSITVSTVSAEDLNDRITNTKIAQLMSSPVYLTSQGAGNSQNTEVDLMVASFESSDSYEDAWKDAVGLLGPSTPNGMNITEITKTGFTFSWNGLGQFRPTSITINNKTTPWTVSTRVANLTSGTTYNIEVTVTNKNGQTANFYIQEKTKNDQCNSGEKCGTNAFCNAITGHCECTRGYNGNPTEGCLAFCKRITTNNNLTFEGAYAGQTTNSEEKCGKDDRSMGSAVCRAMSGGLATYKNIVTIKSCDQTVKDVTSNLTNATISETITERAQQLQLITSNTKKSLSNDDVGRVADFVALISELSDSEKVALDVLESNANTISNLIQSNSLLSSQGDNMNQANDVRKLLASLNALANQVDIPLNEMSRDISTKSMLLQVSSSTGMKSLEYTAVLPDGSPDASMNRSTIPVIVTVPQEAIMQARKNEHVAKTRVSIFVHLNKSLFPSSNTPDVETITAVNIGKNERQISNFGSQLKVTFRNDRRECGKRNENQSKTGNSEFDRTISRRYCVYWDESTNDWRRFGGHVVIDDPDNPVKCAFDHLTNFAVMMVNKKLEPNIGLETWSAVGLSLSIVGLTFTIIIHLVKEDIRKRRPTVILLHICVCLIISHLVFMIGIARIENRVECTVIAAFLQFFYLASWMWMSIYAFDMYRSLVLIFRAAGSKFFTKATIVGYGIPLLITALNAGITVGYFDPRIQPDGVNATADGLYDQWSTCPLANSTYVRENVCWIHSLSLYLGFLTPVAILMIFNIFVYISVIKTIQQRRNKIQSTAKDTNAKDYFFISLTLISSTGIPWAVGYFMLLSDNPGYLTTISWIFATLSTLQGFIIFLCTCVRNENLRNIWLQPLIKCCHPIDKSKKLLSKSYELGDKNSSSQVSNPNSTSNVQLTSASATTQIVKGSNSNV